MRAAYNHLVARLGRLFGSGGILAYHGIGLEPFSPGMHVQADVLRRQLLELRKHYAFVPLVEVVDRLRQGRSLSGCLAVTFDDAYAGVCRYAGPILADLGIPATVFVCSDPARDGGVFWWDLVERIRLDRNEALWKRLVGFIGLDGLPSDDPAAGEQVKKRMMRRWAGRGSALCEALNDGSPVDVWRSANWTELRSLADNESIDFGCHTRTHAALPLLSLADQVDEITDAYEALGASLPRVRPYLAYPYGLYDRQTSELAIRCGMVACFSVEPRRPSRSEFPRYVPRACVHQTTALPDVIGRLSAAHRFGRVILRGRHPRVPTADSPDT